MRRIAIFLTAMACIIPTSVAHARTQTQRTPTIASDDASIGTLSIPRIKVTASIFVGITDVQFDEGVGEWPGSPLPGARGNIVIGGHRTSGHRPFANINKLKNGDAIYLSRGARTYKYVVSKSMVVAKTTIWITKPTPTATLTLFSCHPPGKTSHRFVIRATYVP